MEKKKSLGRGLEDISNVFLTQPAEKKRRSNPSFARPEKALCLSCRNYVQEPFEPPLCKVFAGHNGESLAPHPDAVAMNHAGYCQYFEALSSPEKPAAADVFEKDRSTGHIRCEIEETVTVQRKISYPPRDGAQRDIRKALDEHLDAGFSIKAVELHKVETAQEPQRSLREEKVILCLKEPPA